MDYYPLFREAMVHLEVDSYALLTRLPLGPCGPRSTCMPKARRQRSSWARIKLSKKFDEVLTLHLCQISFYGIIWQNSYHFLVEKLIVKSTSYKKYILTFECAVYIVKEQNM